MSKKDNTLFFYMSLSVCSIVMFYYFGDIYQFFHNEQSRIYQTSDIANYGEYIGNYDNDTPTLFINSFFPESIDDEFRNIDYHYYAKKGDSYAYEAYLEFSIIDTATYTQYKQRFLNQDCVNTPSNKKYPLTDEFYACIVSDDLKLQPRGTNYSVEAAQWGAILYSDEKQSFIFVAIGVHDGGGTYISELSYFFDRFDLDPTSFASHIFK